MTDPSFFGYGSLVNLATHDYANPRPAQLKGWRRVWRQTRLRDLPFLSVEQAEGHSIDGVLADVPGGDWAALDAREAGYDRVYISATLGSNTAIYQVPPRNFSETGKTFPIILSYLDTVIGGFVDMYGADAMARFFETTDGWRVVKNDRAAPIYPRYQPLSRAYQRKVDDLLAAHMEQPM